MAKEKLTGPNGKTGPTGPIGPTGPAGKTGTAGRDLITMFATAQERQDRVIEKLSNQQGELTTQQGVLIATQKMQFDMLETLADQQREMTRAVDEFKGALKAFRVIFVVGLPAVAAITTIASHIFGSQINSWFAK